MLQPRTYYKEEQIEYDIGKYDYQFEYHKPHGALLEPQIRERYRRKSIDGDCYRHYHYELAVVAEHHQGRYLRVEEEKDKYEKQRCGCYGGHSGGIDAVGFLACGVGGKAEVTRLHTIGKYDYNQSYPRVELRDHTVLRYCNDMRIQGHQEPVEKLAHYAAYAVDGCLFCKSFYSRTAHCLLPDKK